MPRYRTHLLTTGLLAAVALAGAAVVIGQGFPQAESAEVLQRAQGTLHDQTEQDAEPHWVLNGDWALRCDGPCADAPLARIGFDLSVNMVRPDGAASHTHQFSDFAASAVTVDTMTDTLIVEGTIVGTGAFGGLSDVVITLADVAGGGAFLVEFPGNPHIIGALGGVVVRSG